MSEFGEVLVLPKNNVIVYIYVTKFYYTVCMRSPNWTPKAFRSF